MKLQIETKYFIAILISALLISIVASASRQPNDYFAFMGTFNDIVTNPIDDNRIDVTYPVYYIPLTGSNTYTFQLVQMTSSINMSQPTQLTNKIKTDIVNFATTRGYNIKKIIMPTYSVNNP